MKYTNPILIAPFFMTILLVLPVAAHADWSGAGMHTMLSPTFVPNHVNVAPPLPVEHYTPRQLQYVRHNPPVRDSQPVKRQQVAERHVPAAPGYFRRDVNYYGHVEVPFPYSDVNDVDTGFVVPDGFDTVMVSGENFYYNQGIFYQQVGDQLTAIPAVLGAVVDSIPEDYQIVMADGVHYLVTGGVYYQRVGQGFEVVQPPGSDQE